MFCIIGEDPSDVEFLKNIVRRITADDSYPIKGIGYGGCGEMLTKGAKQLILYSKLFNPKGYVICYDSDKQAPQYRLKELTEKIINRSGLNAAFCALVPVQEIESWILADLDAVKKVILTWRIQKEILHPESIKDPKELLERLSKRYCKPLYSHATHNPKVAQHLDIEKVYEKCSSFRPLRDFVRDDIPNIDRRSR